MEEFNFHNFIKLNFQMIVSGPTIQMISSAYFFMQFGLLAQKPHKNQEFQKFDQGNTRSIGTSGAICSLNTKIKEVNQWVTIKIL